MNGIVIVDKPSGLTSHDVVSRMRRIFKTRRVGHSGTLDPLATGVLPVFIGRATRACEFALCDEKAYIATFRLGITTDTLDITGEVISEQEVSVSETEVFDVCRSFLGKSRQTPPMYSAIKVGGVALYKLAREGKEIERASREIEITEISPKALGGNEYEISVACSKGTYIRSLIDDIGAKLGCGAVMTSLRRTKSGIFEISDARTIEEIESSPSVTPLDFMFSEYEAVTIDARGEKKCRNGADVPSTAEDGKLYRVYSENGEFLMLARGGSRGELHTVKSFFEVD